MEFMNHIYINIHIYLELINDTSKPQILINPTSPSSLDGVGKVTADRIDPSAHSDREQCVRFSLGTHSI